MSKTIKNSKTEIKKNKDLNDSDILNDILISFKHLVNSYATGLNEASNSNIYKVYYDIFSRSSKIQSSLFQLSFKKGWYTLETADNKKIKKTYDKFNNCKNEL